jgi:hypothetical protein
MRATLIAALMLVAGCREPIVTAPSLLLITTDSLAAQALPCYGGPGGPGRAICTLADRGALFVWAFSTEPVRAQAAATLLTSLSAGEHGLTPSAATFLRSDVRTLATELSAAGLATAAFVSAPELNRSRNFQLGFDRYEVTAAASPGAAAAGTSDAFRAWLQARRPQEQAWFAWLHYPGVDARDRPLRALSLAELDSQVEAVVSAARAVTAEHELGIGFSALSGKAVDGAPPLALEHVRVPLFWTPPGGVTAQRLAAPVALLDLAPSFLQQAGVLVPASLAGEPLRVEPLPPAEVRPARPLRLSAGGEIGVVLSRRYYARPSGAEISRTALLPDDGAWPEVVRVDAGSEAAEPYEAELELPEAR